MPHPTPPPKERVLISDVTGHLASLHERVLFSDMASHLADLRQRPTFSQLFGARILSPLLWIVCGLVVAFLCAWLGTRPTLTQVQSMHGTNPDSKAVVETLRELQRDHADQFRSLFQLLVLSGLIPLITLFAGYTFGVREETRQSTSQDTESNP